MIHIKASNRLAVMAGVFDSCVKDLTSVGFKIKPDGRGVWRFPASDLAKVKKMADALLKKGYIAQGKDLYPNYEDEFYVEKDGVQICLDPSGYVYMT